MRNLKSVRRTPLARSHRFVLAALLFLCANFHASVLYALHEVDHRVTVQGRICGEGGEGLDEVLVTATDTRADVSGKAKSDSNGFYKILLHLHDENQGDPLVVHAKTYEAKGRVDLDPQDRKTERIVTIDLGKPCLPLPLWQRPWFVTGFIAVIGFIVVLTTRKIRGRNSKRLDGMRKGKDRRR